MLWNHDPSRYTVLQKPSVSVCRGVFLSFNGIYRPGSFTVLRGDTRPRSSLLSTIEPRPGSLYSVKSDTGTKSVFFSQYIGPTTRVYTKCYGGHQPLFLFTM